MLLMIRYVTFPLVNSGLRMVLIVLLLIWTLIPLSGTMLIDDLHENVTLARWAIVLIVLPMAVPCRDRAIPQRRVHSLLVVDNAKMPYSNSTNT